MEPAVNARGNLVVTLCGVQGCCPTVEFAEDEVILRDDHDGQVRLTLDEWAELKELAKSERIPGQQMTT